MKNLLLGSLLAAVAVFFWGFVFWAVLAEVDTMSPEAELALQGAMADHVPATGTYVIPNMHGDEAEFTLRHETGPTAMLFVRTEGSEPMNAASMAFGFLHEFLFALIIGVLLRLAWDGLPSYRHRVGLVVLAGVAAAFWGEIAYPIWWLHPWGFHLLNAVYVIVAWSITGLIMARFAAPKSVSYATPLEAPATPV